MWKTSMTAMAAAALLVLAVATPTAAAPSSVGGHGTVVTEFEGQLCEDLLVISGASDDNTNWDFVVQGQNPEQGGDPPDVFCFVVVPPATFQGAWDPWTGGCIPPTSPGFGQLCLENPAPWDDVNCVPSAPVSPPFHQKQYELAFGDDLGIIDGQGTACLIVASDRGPK